MSIGRPPTGLYWRWCRRKSRKSCCSFEFTVSQAQRLRKLRAACCATCKNKKMRWPCTLLLAVSIAQVGVSQDGVVRIGVLGIFHPLHLVVAADAEGELLLSADARQLFVRPRSSCSTATLRASGDTLVARCGGKEIRAA